MQLDERFLEAAHIIWFSNSPFPRVDYRSAVDAIDGVQNSLAEFLRRGDADLAKHRSGELEKKPSMRFTQERCLGESTKVKRPFVGSK
jgi:hypothetical protein